MTTNNGLASGATFTRNRFFYGKLMDVRHFEMEQRYFLEKARTMRQSGFGSGVVCGLQVRATDAGTLIIEPGLAVDPLGRMIRVGRPYELEDPLQPRDPCGRPDGEPVRQGTVTICLVYHECEVDPSPAFVAECDTERRCVAGSVSERFEIVIHRGPPSVRDRLDCEAIFPPEPAADFDRRRAACTTLTGPCPESEDPCVVLATLTVPGSAGQAFDVDACGARSLVPSNQTLYELLLCLANRVDQCCGDRPAVVRPPIINAIWPPSGAILAPEGGLGSPAVWFELLQESQEIEVTFDRPMDAAYLALPDGWLRAWVVGRNGDGDVEARRAKIELAGLVSAPVLAVPGVTVAYRMSEPDGRTPTPAPILDPALPGNPEVGVGHYVILQIRSGAGGGDIADTASPARMLDPDFAGTGLEAAQLDTLWSADETTLPLAVWDSLTSSSQALPSGDGLEGGRLHAAFAFVLKQTRRTPPVVLEHWPPNGVALSALDAGLARPRARMWNEAPRIELTFDRALAPTALSDPSAWLRLRQAVPRPRGGVVVTPLELAYEAESVPRLTLDRVRETLPIAGVTYTFVVAEDIPRAEEARYLVQLRPQDGVTVDDADPPSLLDADFSGTKLTQAQLDSAWVLTAPADVGDDVWQGLEATGVPLPSSGDGQPGGEFHLTFLIRGPQS